MYGRRGLYCLYYKVLIREDGFVLFIWEVLSMEDRFVGTVYIISTIYARIVLVI